MKPDDSHHPWKYLTPPVLIQALALIVLKQAIPLGPCSSIPLFKQRPLFA